jgi:3-deoxy-7-phosphoheptulonate synthase
MARAAAAVGADGLMIEVHHDPDKALSDGAQSIFPYQFDQLIDEVRQIANVVGRSVHAGSPVVQTAKSAD